MDNTLGVILLLICVLIVSMVETFGIPYQTTIDGTHTGIVTAVETTGLIFKTITVYVKTDATSSQEDAYCLKDSSLVPILKEYEKSKEKVTLFFEDYLIKGLINCDGEQAIITGARR